MRRANAVLSALILFLFLMHAVLGAFQLFDLGAATMKGLAHGLSTLVGIHTVLGVLLTVRSIRVWRRTGAPYLRQNALFWARRLSGLAIMALLVFHLYAFSYTAEGVFRLRWFTGARLATQLMLLASIAVHVIANVKPMLISFGVRRLKPRSADLLFVLSALLLVMAAAFVIYYLRWNG